MSSGATVLVVDDESLLRTVIARALAENGYRVMEAGDGVEALQMLGAAGAGIHLVITDIRMPRMDGYELADRIRVWPKPVPMIFISGYGQDGVWLPGSIFPKPFTMDALLTEVRRLVPAAPPPLLTSPNSFAGSSQDSPSTS